MRFKFPYLPVLATPYIIFGLGVFLNILAVTVNQGTMPVAHAPFIDIMLHPGDMIDEVHRMMQHADHLKILCDWIQLPRKGVCSIGDLCLWGGDWLMGPSFVSWLTLLWRDANPVKSL